MKIFAKLALVLFLAASPVVALAQTSGGGYSQAYLTRNVGARASALAGAYTAVANEPSAIFYNPAGLSFLPGAPIFSTNVSYLGLDRYQSSLAWGQQINEFFGLGAGINALTTGSFMGTDRAGRSIGEFNSNQYTLTVAGSYALEFASLGGAVKYCSDNLVGAGVDADGFAVDLGAKFNMMDILSMGVAVQNLGGAMYWNDASGSVENLPFSLRLGLAMELALSSDNASEVTPTGENVEAYEPATRYALFSLDVIKRQYSVAPSIVLGSEIVLHEAIALRGGISLYGDVNGSPRPLPGNEWGAGVSVRPTVDGFFDAIPVNLHIDYSASQEYLSPSGVTHSISIILGF
ncbi:MAG: PorV/PorQ family protein [Chloroflexota bacterium]